MFLISNLKIGLLICMLCWITGMAISLNFPLLIKSESFPNYQLIYNHNITVNISAFSKVLFNNLFIGLILSVLGYFSFGFISIIVSIYNGFIFSLYINEFIMKYSIYSFYLVCFHVPTEFFALCYLGSIGLRGNKNLIYIISNKEYLYFERFPSLKVLTFPIILLAFSALIESDIIFNLLLQ